VKYETKMAAARCDLAVTVGVVGAPSSGIELVLSKNLAQIRVICKNGPQVSIDDIKWSGGGCSAGISDSLKFGF
jgi:hypothetical protein